MPIVKRFDVERLLVFDLGELHLSPRRISYGLLFPRDANRDLPAYVGFQCTS